MHSMVNMPIKNCDWTALENQLWRDTKELPNIFGKAEYYDMKVLNGVKDRYFPHLELENSIASEHTHALTDALREKMKRNLFGTQARSKGPIQAEKEQGYWDPARFRRRKEVRGQAGGNLEF